MSFSALVERVIALAKQIRVYWDQELPRRHPHYPVVGAGEDSGPPPPEEHELLDYLTQLPDESIYRIIFLMYLGRGDFTTEHLVQDYRHVRSRFDEPASAIRQMMAKTPLDEYLEAGLAIFQRAKKDVNRVMAVIK